MVAQPPKKIAVAKTTDTFIYRSCFGIIFVSAFVSSLRGLTMKGRKKESPRIWAEGFLQSVSEIHLAAGSGHTVASPIELESCAAKRYDNAALGLAGEKVNEALQPSSCDDCPCCCCRDLIEMLGDDASRFDQLINSKSRLIGSHGEEVAAVDDSEIYPIARCLGRPIPNQTGVACPKH